MRSNLPINNRVGLLTNPIIYEFILESEEKQSKEVFAVCKGYRTKLPRRVYMDGGINDTTDLLKAFESLSPRDQIEFREKYGQLDQLLRIPVQEEALDALVCAVLGAFVPVLQRRKSGCGPIYGRVP